MVALNPPASGCFVCGVTATHVTVILERQPDRVWKRYGPVACAAHCRDFWMFLPTKAWRRRFSS